MNFIWDALPTANWVISLILLVLLDAFLIYSHIKVIKRRVPFIVLSALLFVGFLAFLFNLMYVFIATSAIVICEVMVSIFVNLGSFRSIFANPFKVTRAGNSKFVLEKAFDKEAMYKAVEAAVLDFSKSRTGAIITFEKNTPLNDIVKNGVPVNAPVSTELLQTIFYPGTRLHDGAVVIHRGVIVAASVFFTPTTKAFAGKYGSRHRAGIGISEISDAVTVIVSEETGRIAFAINGHLEPVEPNSFLRVFENYMETIKEE